MNKYLEYKNKYLLNKNILNGGNNTTLRIYRLLYNEGIITRDSDITYHLYFSFRILSLKFMAQDTKIDLQIYYDENYPRTPPITFKIDRFNFLNFEYIMYIKFIEPFLPNLNNMKFMNYIEFIRNNLLLAEPIYTNNNISLVIGAKPDDKNYDSRNFFDNQQIYLLSEEESENKKRYFQIDFNNIDELERLVSEDLKFQTICFDYSTWKFFSEQDNEIEYIIKKINLLSELLMDDGILIIPEPLELTMITLPDDYITLSSDKRKIIKDNITKEYCYMNINAFINSKLKFNFIRSDYIQNKVFQEVTNAHRAYSPEVYQYLYYEVLIATKK
jgi:hypothetical protein